MSQIFRDPEVQARFDETGMIESPFLDGAEIEQLRNLYLETAGSHRKTFEVFSPLTYYISIFDSDPEVRRAANDGIREVFADKLDDLMIDYRILYCNFMVKDPGAGEIEAHQDFTWVDEDRHVGFNLWVPLQDTGPHNGCFYAIDGSHRLLDTATYRCSSAPDTLTAYNEALKEFMVAKPLAAGNGFVFDHRLIHYSPVNLSETPRLAAQLVLVPAAAPAVFAEYEDGQVNLLEIPDDDYLTRHNFWERAGDDLPVVATRPYDLLPSEDTLIEMLRQRSSGG